MSEPVQTIKHNGVVHAWFQTVKSTIRGTSSESKERVFAFPALSYSKCNQVWLASEVSRRRRRNITCLFCGAALAVEIDPSPDEDPIPATQGARDVLDAMRRPYTSTSTEPRYIDQVLYLPSE